MTTVATLVIFLVSIPCTHLLGMVSTWQDLRERDLVFFFEAYAVTFFMAMPSLKKMLFGFGSLILEKEMRGRHGPTEHAKILATNL